MIHGMLRVGAEAGSSAENPREHYAIPELARLVRGSSVTAHCHAATAQPIREYQGDHRRTSLTSPRLAASRLTFPSISVLRLDEATRRAILGPGPRSRGTTDPATVAWC